jgi:hypothetical protein
MSQSRDVGIGEDRYPARIRSCLNQDILPFFHRAQATMLFQNRRVIIEQAAQLRLPTIYQWPETAEEGGLLGYGPWFIELFRERARMVAKILRGSKPA